MPPLQPMQRVLVLLPLADPQPNRWRERIILCRVGGTWYIWVTMTNATQSVDISTMRGLRLFSSPPRQLLSSML